MQVQEGLVVEVKGVKYRFGPISTYLFNQCVELERLGMNLAEATVPIYRIVDNKPCDTSIADLKAAVRAALEG